MGLLEKFSEKKVVLVPLSLVIVLSLLFVWLGRPEKPESNSEINSGSAATLMWENLAELDYKNGTAPKKLLDVSGTRVRIPGFVVPLEDNAKKIGEFLLVPYAQACIHVPAPPPNQMVHVQMESGKYAENSPFPVWVEGIINLKEKDSTYGKASFTMTGQKVERYKDQK